MSCEICEFTQVRVTNGRVIPV